MVRLVEYFKPKNYFYYLHAKLVKWLVPDTSSLVITAMYKASKCPDCYKATECIHCGCDFNEMVLTNKPCPENKW